MDPILAKFMGCLIGTAVGDSLGARREGSLTSAESADLAPRYTDDTALTIAVAESLAECRQFHYWHMADRFLKKYEQEPWRRYGHTLSRVFRLMRNGKLGFGMIDRDLYPDGSFGNGAPMRVAPVGLLYYDDPKMLRETAYHCAGITHSHELGLEGAAIQACAVALAVLAEPDEIRTTEFLGALRMFTKPGPYQDKLKTIVKLLGEEPAPEAVAAELGTGASSVESVSVSIYSFLANRDFKGAVTFAVSLGGDSDTIGAMTGAIAGACYGIEGIPSQWLETVENRFYIEQLARKLWEVKMGISRSPADAEAGTAASADN
ncbi:MAG: ADP-ribosylglycohydrolase family protein [Nitrospirota bacterium]